MKIYIILEKEEKKEREKVEVALNICDEITTMTLGTVPIILSDFNEKSIDKTSEL